MSPSIGIPPINKAAHLPTTRSTTVEGEGHSLAGSSEVKVPEIIGKSTYNIVSNTGNLNIWEKYLLQP